MASNFSETIKEIYSDINCYKKINGKSYLFILLRNPGLWILIQHRLSKWVKIHFKIPILRQLLRFICAVWEQMNQMILHCEFPNTAEIGSGLCIPHPYCIVIHSNAQIGTNCLISQNVTIGVGGRREKSGVPKIGDRVYIAPGAKIFGAITIGNDVAIGANAVVTKDLVDNAVAIGIPAKTINYKSSKDYITYTHKSNFGESKNPTNQTQ